MNPEIKTRWLEALRSGRYEQTTGYLHTRKNGGDQFCCLGVLCDVLITEGLYQPDMGNRSTAPEVEAFEYVSYDDEPGVLPVRVREIVGLNSNPSIAIERDEDDAYRHLYPTYETTLADLNDNGKTLAEIADLIDAQL